MDLKTWIDEKRGRQTMLAGEVKAQPQLVWQWSSGARQVPGDRCPAIERATGGEVTCEEIRADLPWLRVTDPEWQWHPEGRPALDVTRALTEAPAAVVAGG